MDRQLPLILRFVWFVFVGLVLGGTMTAIGWLLCVTIVGMPLGIWLLHRAPLVMTLRMDATRESGTGEEIVIGDRVYRAYRPHAGVEQHSFLLRALWYVLFGWWFTGLWLVGAYVMTGLILTMPIAFWMYNRVPWLLTLDQT